MWHHLKKEINRLYDITYWQEELFLIYYLVIPNFELFMFHP